MDIIFFAVLAIVIFYKLSKHLGRIDEEEKKHIEEKIAQVRAAQEQIIEKIKQQEVVVGSSSTTEQKELEDKSLENLPQAQKQSLQEVLSRCNINLSFFLSGAKSAFEIVIKSFASGDLASLKMLLSEKIYQGFEAAVNQRLAQEKLLTTNLIAIEKTEIISAMLMENTASIVVKFTSKQINYISDKNGAVLEGNKNEIAEVVDVWTFKKDVTSPNPNWIISATGA